MINYPWNNMEDMTKRRVNIDTIFDIFWIKVNNREGMLFKIPIYSKEYNTNYSFREMEVIQQKNENYKEIYLLLKNKENKEIFYILCKDLCAVTIKYNNIENITAEIFNRLKKWQNMLSNQAEIKLSIEVERGLFAELYSLIEYIIPKFGIEKGIHGWTGADYDKQDFNIDNFLVEVKSYSGNKGKKILISSPEQLYSTSFQKLYLIAINLLLLSSGKNLNDLIEKIYLLLKDNINLKEEFELKILNYGYIREIHSKFLNTFIIGTEEIYIVNDKFPKINYEQLPCGVSNVKYVIDLNICNNNKIDIL